MPDIAAQARYEQFVELHRGPDTFIMPNAWDGPSALLFKEAGFKSIATSSAAFAATPGRIDGIHAVSRDTHLDHAALLTSVSGLPINGDFGDGCGEAPEDVRATVAAAIARGLTGSESRTPLVTIPTRFVTSMTRFAASRLPENT
ncbi:isocitrate lyase/phosphoenolpyruvate mutase family protein [Streptosporangium sp. 'caverna']|uniref:isocitrate lyase/phosphoenolpyruvate mutase family protein n=1 Tax=Streptosporangium sp. 'caverna' TaxID=2202249 RepID=UPI0019551518|nr:isocitrate lyase/phosphoenolpyruvate mutase family protein [Streptosporangium sp. 'caverna']